MSDFTYHDFDHSGANLYLVIRSLGAGTVRDHSVNPYVFVAPVVANWDNYDVPGAESPASSGIFGFTVPVANGVLAAGMYVFEVYRRIGAAAAASDLLLAQAYLPWSGTAIVDESAADTRTLPALPAVLPGAAGGLLIAGSNAATIFNGTAGPGLQAIGTTIGFYTQGAWAGVYNRATDANGVGHVNDGGTAGIGQKNVGGAKGQYNLGDTGQQNQGETKSVALVGPADKLDNLDVTVGSRAAPGAKMDLIDALSTTALAVIAAAIWNRLTSAMTTAGSIGKKLADWVILLAADVHPVVAPVTLVASPEFYTLLGGATQPIDLAQSAASRLCIRLVDAAGDPVDLGEADLVFRVVAGEDEVLRLTEGDGIRTTDPDDGQVEISFSTADTATVGTQAYEFWDVASDTLFAKGKFVVRPTFGPGTA